MEHYKNAKYELRYIIEDIVKSQNLPNYEAVLVSNVLKYVARYNTKNGLADLLKAQDVLKWLVKEVQSRDKDLS